MKKTKLISGADARPRATQHRTPCSDCPFARAALPGWLGSLSPEEWIKAAHGESTSDCHTTTNQQCAGLAIYRANVGKIPRDDKALRLPKDKELVFARPAEFLEHHK